MKSNHSKTLLHEQKILQGDFFARVFFLIFVKFFFFQIFFLIITVTFNPYPRSITFFLFFFNNTFIYFIYFVYFLCI